MKIKIDNYLFNKTAKTVTFPGYVSIDLAAVLLITNVTDNIIIYNFADATKGGIAATNVLTLDYDTSTMDDADDLQIFYEDTAIAPATEAKQDGQTATIQDFYNMLLFAVDRMEFGLATDLAKRLKINLVDSGALASVTAVGTVTTVATVASLTNTVRQGDMQMQRVNEALLDTAFILGIGNNITY